jgi:hypothetical protein
MRERCAHGLDVMTNHFSYHFRGLNALPTVSSSCCQRTVTGRRYISGQYSNAGQEQYRKKIVVSVKWQAEVYVCLLSRRVNAA